VSMDEAGIEGCRPERATRARFDEAETLSFDRFELWCGFASPAQTSLVRGGRETLPGGARRGRTERQKALGAPAARRETTPTTADGPLIPMRRAQMPVNIHVADQSGCIIDGQLPTMG
jgi:hypothetical protein